MDSMVSRQRPGFNSACASFADRPRAAGKKQAFVERAGGRPWPQVTSSAKISSYRLVVGFGIVGQRSARSSSWRRSSARSGLNDDTAWNTECPRSSTTGAKDLTAGTARHRVIHEQRGVGVAACR